MTAVGFDKIEVLFAGDRGPFGEDGTELRRDFGADFVAAFTDARTDGGTNIGRLGTEIAVHFFNGSGDDGRHSAAPTGMHGGDSAFIGVEQQNGYAIGSAHTDAAVEIVGDERVAFALAIR